jgi:hypothetical protein
VETWRHPALDWKWEVHVSGLKSGSSGKKPYDRPSYTTKPISEAGTLARKKTADHGNTRGADGASTIGGLPIFLVEGYEGELGFIEKTIRTPARQLAPFSILKGAAMVEMQFADGQEKAAPETFFVWDLRQRRNGERGLLESIGGIPDLGDAVLLVILVSSMEQFEGRTAIDVAQCWQLRGRPSAEDLASTLRSLLHLCAAMANRPREESAALEKTGKYALIAKAHKK